ncbi:MAG TPA: diaminopimelate epimerase [Candidatus Nanopelagicaceae bacterium]|nr:diaminopimelate epimerase [Candidatus Nanopelagicaceae bacterium]
MDKISLENLDFEKHHGLGNDYILINNLKWDIPDDKKADLAIKLCKHHFSVGADGVLFVCHPKLTEVRIKIFNPDGSQAEMCGNGVRCFAKYIYENDIYSKEEIEIETLNGIVVAKLKVVNNEVETVTIDMGPPVLDCENIPVNLESLVNRCVNESIVVLDKIFNFTAVSMGNPHAIIFTKEVINDENLKKYGVAIESNKIFPKKTNVEFVKVLSKDEAVLRVFERGVGVTNSCGTGTCAAVVAGTILGKFNPNTPVTVHNDGGDLKITYNGKTVYMEGPTEKVFKGVIDRIEF